MSKAAEGGQLRAADIPFLSSSALNDLKYRVTGHKKMFFVLARRWHPDKFLPSFGAQLHPDEVETIKERVKNTFQDIQSKLKR